MPEADALEKTAARPSDRMLRTTRDRQQAVVRAQADERRRTSDRLPSDDAAPAAHTQTSDLPPEVPPPEPPVTAEGPQTRKRTQTIRIFAAEHRTIVIGCLLLVTAVWGYVVWYPDDHGGGILHPPPDIPALSATELAALPDDRLLERIERECLRRLYTADIDLRSAATVLTPPATHLWRIGYGEVVLRSCNLRQALMAERNPRCSPSMPTLKQMAEAYRALELLGPAQALEDALEIVDPGDDNDPYVAVQARYQAEIATRSPAARLAYARDHRSELFPTP